MTSFGLVSVTLMRADNEHGWIGAIILGILAIIAVVCIWWYTNRAGEYNLAQRTDGFTGHSEVLAPMKRVSPFYVTTTSWDPAAVAPNSQMREALNHRAPIGRGGEPFDPRSLPGIAELEDPQLPPRAGANSVTNQ
jgi:hypothetical protein